MAVVGAAVRRCWRCCWRDRSWSRRWPESSPGCTAAFWFLFKVSAYIYVFMWLRFTFPRYRFDQLMQLGWQFLLPVAMANVVGIAIALVLHRGLGWNVMPAFALTTVLTLVVAAFLVWVGEKKE